MNRIEAYIQRIVLNQSPYTNVIGLARSFIALGTLLTLLFNGTEIFINMIDDLPVNPVFTSPIGKFNFFLLFGIKQVLIMKYIAIIVLIGIISGVYPQVTCLFHWWISFSFITFSSAIDGGDQIASILTFLLIPICLTDRRKNHWHIQIAAKQPINLIAIFFVWLIRLQMAVIYFHAAVGKFNVTEWSNGTGLYYWLYNSFFRMPQWVEPLMYPIIVNSYGIILLTYGVLVFELLLFLGLTIPSKYRIYLLILGIMFHFFIIIFLGIFTFFFSMTAGLILYLYPTYKPINIKTFKQLLLMKAPT
ncbi:MAG: hypothetical protein IPJ74_01895 [Saprospiraceae bacterium]|nr:hypothetical protein [Saprospiraceae bacterium]